MLAGVDRRCLLWLAQPCQASVHQAAPSGYLPKSVVALRGLVAMTRTYANHPCQGTKCATKSDGTDGPGAKNSFHRDLYK